MNADDSVPNSVPPPRELIDGETSGKIIGAFFVVYNTLGFGFLESVYERAMYVALRNRGVHVKRQVPFEIYFEGDLVGRHRADLLVEHRDIGVGSQPEGAPPMATWNTYVWVESADETASKVKAAGGTVLMVLGPISSST